MRRGQHGVTLIEALVSLGVVSIGMLGMAQLDAHLTEVSGQAKARTQATRLAHAKLADLRNLATRGEFTALASLAKGTAETLAGNSAAGSASTSFSRWWDVSGSGTAPTRQVRVFVAWNDRYGKARQVAVSTVVAWEEPTRGSALLAGGLAGSLAPRPGGRALPGSGTATVPATPPNDAGLWEVQDAEGRYRLIDATGKILLAATTAGERFSEIRGGVYVDQANASFAASVATDDVYVVLSEAGYCVMQPLKGQSPPAALLALPASGTAAYRYLTYRCYVGADWYGNIGVVRTNVANTNDRVCVGDPAVATVSPSVKSDNRHPALGAVRAYRGFSGSAPYYAAAGIGIVGSAYTPATYDGHDFVLARLSGVPADADCQAPLQRLTSPANPFSVGGNATTLSPVTETAYLQGGNAVVLGNPGKAFCLSANCPEDGSLEPPTPVTIRVTGTVERASATSDRPTLAGLTTNSGTCAVSGGSGHNSYAFDCEFTGAGFSGGQWSGELRARTGAGEFICSSGFSATPSGSTTGPATPVADTHTFVYASQPIGSAPTLRFRIGKSASDC